MIMLSRLAVYPVKSMRGLQLSHAQVLPGGLAFDRIFMITDTDGTFITARQFPQMVLFTAALLTDGLHLSAPDGSSASVRFTDFSADAAATEVWGNHFTAHIAPAAINQWLSGFFPRAVQLRWTGNLPTRRVKQRDDVPLGFADGYPFLLTNDASLRDLQHRCPAGVRMEQFRPNLVISGASAWAEDSWSSLRIGEIIFDVPKPCSRCIFTTVSPSRGQKHPSGEPLATLQRFRTAQDNSGDVDFGLNLIARNSGIIRTGDEVEILTLREPRHYGAGEVAESIKPLVQPEQSVTITYQGRHFRGNNQQILLEQLEMQGEKIAYSCRAGICGSCALRLVAGKVKPLKQTALQADGKVLSCSCIPDGDIELA